MSKQSGFLKKQEQEKDALMQAAQGIIIQYMLDTLQITMREQYGWGYDRIMRLTEEWKRTRMHYQAAIEPRDKLSDVMQEHMQRVFDDICAYKKIASTPWDERYPYLAKIRYDRRYK